MPGRIEGPGDRRKIFPPIDPRWALAALVVVAALVVPVVASIRAASRPAIPASEATRAPAPGRTALGTTPIPGRGALPLCPTSRVVARPANVDTLPSVEVEPGKEDESGERLTPKGRL